MTDTSGSQFTAFIDPNNDPEFSYSHLEGWLLLYDQIYVSSPSPHQVARASVAKGMPPVREDTLEQLVREKWLVPVGRRRFFNEDWRRARAKELETSDRVRAAHFRWSGDFDRTMAKHAVPLEDSALDAAIKSGQNLEHRHPDAFAWLSGQVGDIKANDGLPAKFHTPSERDAPVEQVARDLIYEVAGDLWARSALNATGLIVPTGHEAIYGLLDDAARSGDASPLQPRMSALKPQPSGTLSAEDERLARELAERISRNYTIADVIKDYRGSQLEQEMRGWVLNAMDDLRERIDPRAYGARLWDKFEDHVKHIELVYDTGAIAARVGVAAVPLLPAVGRLMKQGMSRRALLALALFKTTEYGSRPLLGPMTDAAESRLRGEHDR